MGFNAEGHNARNPHDVHANIPTEEIGEIIHPRFFIPNRNADLYQLSLSMPKDVAPAQTSMFRKMVNRAIGAGDKQ